MFKTPLLLALLVFGASPGIAQERRSRRDFSWDGRIATSRWLTVRNLNGAVRVERSADGQTSVTAEKRWRRGNPEVVRIEAHKIGPGDEDVLICAIWDESTTCDENGYRRPERRRDWDDRNDVSVEFVVRIAAGVNLRVHTVNGALDVDGATGIVEAHTVNGSIVARSTGGPVVASTVNGSIEAHMATLGDRDLEFETVNGSIEVYVPEGLDAELDMRTVNGGVTSDFPLVVSGKINARHVRATIGKGGRRLEFRTVNGGVRLYRA
ncbi:MAG: hypothetical protein MNPFHGCM_02404 [Gemmatimonadaceae bacterium]|nr:hypothetical protein [Gemmatimonadaceae bacterium]